ncbi:10544_t:CDS:2 [Cetraspora pellucida]|uniref:10544_t:CDS:1 n=1 Tax=Cetraspora pellucida TaxID=1433469 RepID=A0A9N9GFA1_9GLOM|nr:10544_t:CDS:2 [Cetraspora pellucida]
MILKNGIVGLFSVDDYEIFEIVKKMTKISSETKISGRFICTIEQTTDDELEDEVARLKESIRSKQRKIRKLERIIKKEKKKM